MKNILYLIIGLLIGFLASKYFFNQSLTDDTMDIIKPKGVITSAEAKQLDQNFNARHELISDSIVGKPDNRSSWYSLEDMRNYLDYAENQARELGYTMDGIRIYVGSHGPKDYTTMFMVPTGFEVGGMLPTAASGDIDGVGGLNNGNDGIPPSANYPQ